jgi:hypothetical protein
MQATAAEPLPERNDSLRSSADGTRRLGEPMQRERYPGEAAGLRNFLAGLLPVAERELGPDSLLLHAIRRALKSGALADLRRARQMFNLLPRERKRALSSGLVAARREPRDADPVTDRGPWITFDGGNPTDRGTRPRIGIGESTVGTTGGLLVLVRPGTLPSFAAGALRRIARLIEDDRRLLSDRFWFGRSRDAGGDTGA